MEGHWQALVPSDVASLFEGADFPWWIAGGHAIDQLVGRSLRPHADIDVLILRKDQLRAQRMLARWDWWASDPPGRLRPWQAGEFLPVGVSDIWCRQEQSGPWRLQLMLDEGDEHQWRSRRNSRVTKPVAEIGLRNENGVPFLSAEIQLFYKAKASRPKDDFDFAASLPHLTPMQRTWLRSAILMTYGEDNPWLKALADY